MHRWRYIEDDNDDYDADDDIEDDYDDYGDDDYIGDDNDDYDADDGVDGRLWQQCRSW